MKYALFFLALIGCGPQYSETDVSSVVATNPGDTVSVQHITITEGHVVKAHIVVKDDDDKPMGIVLKPLAPQVMDVHYATTPDDFVFEAGSVGAAQFQVFADGDLVLTIDGSVVPQTSP